jgi:hypothetical protein
MHIFSDRYRLRNDHRLPAAAGKARFPAPNRISPELTRAELRDIIIGQLG